jgi:hypothetical protein
MIPNREPAVVSDLPPSLERLALLAEDPPCFFIGVRKSQKNTKQRGRASIFEANPPLFSFVDAPFLLRASVL